MVFMCHSIRTSKVFWNLQVFYANSKIANFGISVLACIIASQRTDFVCLPTQILKFPFEPKTNCPRHLINRTNRKPQNCESVQITMCVCFCASMCMCYCVHPHTLQRTSLGKRIRGMQLFNFLHIFLIRPKEIP